MITHSEGGGRRKDVRIYTLIEVDNERRARDGVGTRQEGNRNSENAAHRDQHQCDRNGRDHAREGEHRYDVKNKKRERRRRKAETGAAMLSEELDCEVVETSR